MKRKSVILAILLLVVVFASGWCPIEIWDQVVGPQLTQGELIALLGPPDFVGTFANEYYDGPLWQYYDLTVDCAGDGTVYNQNFLFENGRVFYDWVESTRRVNLFLPLI